MSILFFRPVCKESLTPVNEMRIDSVGKPKSFPQNGWKQNRILEITQSRFSRAALGHKAVGRQNPRKNENLHDLNG